MKSLMILLGLAAGAAVAVPPLPSPDLTLTGRVTDATTGQPLRDALVSSADADASARTDRSGGFALSFPDALAGTATRVTVERVGYTTLTASVLLEPGATLSLGLVATTPERAETVVDGAVAEKAATLEERWRAVDATGVAMPATSALRLGGRYNPSFNTESYALVEENGFRSASGAPLSTFSIDVDRASYSNIRRFINDGRRPPIDAVRIEEMVNYFPYGYTAPDGASPFAVTTEVAPAPWEPRHLLLRVGLRARDVDVDRMPPNNLVFLLDVSGSMQSPDKLPLLKTSLRLLVNQLRPQDRVAIVVYAGAAGLALPSTDGNRRQAILDAIEGLEAGGSTAGGAGLTLAYRVAREHHELGANSRVILATDGDFNVGPSSNAEMVRLVEENRDGGVFLSVLGFGTGNLKDDKMEQIADHGNGNYAYIDGVLEARKQLVTEMGGTLLTLAQDVKIQVEFNPARVEAYRLIGYENRLLEAEDFNDDSKDAGELGAGHVVTALYEVVPVGAETGVDTGTVDALRYQSAATPRTAGSDELLFVKVRYKVPGRSTSRLLEHPVHAVAGDASIDLRFAGAVAAFGMLLRESEHCGDFAIDDVLDLARGALGDDPHGYRAEFVRLVEASRDLGLFEPDPL